MITDPTTGVSENITINAGLDLAQLVITLGQELSSEGNLYPKIEITDVAFTLHPDKFSVKSDGELSVYKNR